MLVKLKHEIHGLHIAYSQAEVDACKLNGWTELDAPVLPTKETVEAEEPKRRGRPKKAEIEDITPEVE